ncbi:MAG TPA: bifunctional shikimate kinase/3-dehydroquinate synthase [Candidatus Limnocylindrales bacterium]|nr:bifunctional shikimate kinase/3-dehydroquinate synthase [Candidatus Limnocylindrales bacterium]
MSEGIVLVGLPGSGKSAVGRNLAERLDRPFFDLDAEIARAAGRSPAEIIDNDGEPAFRALERRALEKACSEPRAVIGTGGGTPLDPLNRWTLMSHGLRVRLDAPLDRLADRLASDTVSRPLLGSDLLAGLSRTAEARAAVYRAVDVTIDASEPVDVVAGRVIEAQQAHEAARTDGWRPLYDASYRRHHPGGPEAGRVVLGRNLDPAAVQYLLAPFDGHVPAVVADARALDAHPRLAAALPTPRSHLLEGGEQAKSFTRLHELLTWLSAAGAERGDPLVAVGGGTIGDVAGLAAALHHRGMALVHVPTTWLAQADSSIGGKVAIDLPGAKNAVGAFWPAWLIISDTTLLDTLPVRQRRDGMAEVLKCGLIGDPLLWELIEIRGAGALAGNDAAAGYAMTERAARVKLDVVERDPYERDERRTLNLGHTVGHALEVESGYQLPHGEAVGLGLRAVAHIAAGRDAERGLAERIDEVLIGLGFPLRRRFDAAAVRGALGSDKKRVRGRQRWILPVAVGRVAQVDDVTDAELDAALAAIGE